MKMKIINTLVILAMVLALPVIATRSASSTEGVSVKPRIAIGSQTPTGTHLVMPREDLIIRELQKEGKLTLSSSEEEIQAAIQQYKYTFAKKSDTWINPEMEEKALAHEDELADVSLDPNAPELAVQPVDVSIFALAVDFADTDETVYYDDVYSDDGCDLGTVLSDTFAGPLVGNIPYPDVKDNWTLWYDPAEYADDPTFYNNLIFGYDGVGRIRMDLTDPRDGLAGINLAGYTVQDYYDHVAGAGNVALHGNTYGWVTVDHPEAYYGADSCDGSHYGGAYESDGVTPVPVAKLVKDAVEKFNAALPAGFDWTDYDQNADGLVDTFWIIYSGVGQEAGGGAQGDFALWSHSSDTRYYFLGGIQVYEGDPGTEDDDIYVGPYTMQPETADIGVLSEEFGHNVFGFPDLYVTDTQGSIAFWSNMEAGSWGGYLGGSTPVGMPLWFRMIAWCDIDYCNWQSTMLVRNYDDLSEDVTLRQLEEQTYDASRPDWGVTTPHRYNYKGVRINLPQAVETIPNNAGTGNAAWSSTGNYADYTLARSIAVPAGTDILLQVASYWDIEEDYDYGYFEVDAGGGWINVPDVAGYCVSTVLGCGITGYDSDSLQYDLTAYAGTTIAIRFRYVTDPFVNGAGWWLDNITLDGTLIEDFETASLPDVFPGSWTNDGWAVTPYTEYHNQYYMVEWRNDTKYDQMVQQTYKSIDRGENYFTVARVPYNIPGALVYYRNTGYSGTYAQLPNYGDPPSYGPKYQLLLVDMNPMPVPIGDYGETGSYFYPNVGSYDAALTLDSTDPFTLPYVYTLEGPFDYASKPAVSTFNDAQKYYSGYIYDPETDTLYFEGFDDSAVIPARDKYSVGIWDYATGEVPSWWTQYYGYPDGTSWLGNGEPGYDSVQFGVNIDLLSQGTNGEYGVLRFRNHSVDFDSFEIGGSYDGFQYEVSYVTLVDNLSPRNVYDLYVEYDTSQDGCKIYEANAYYSTGGTESLGIEPYYMKWSISEDGLESGQAVAIVVSCYAQMKGMPPGAYIVDTDAWVNAYDGQIERGWWEVNYADSGVRSGYGLALPIIIKK
jgi:immune inhibitor A